VVLVHGEAVEMSRLKRALEAAAAAAQQPLHVYTPKNCQSVAIAHRGEKVARVLGRLAERAAAAAESGQPARLSGVLVQKEFGYTLLHPADLATYTRLRAGSLRQRQLVPCAAPFTAVRLALEQLFDAIAVVRSAPPEGGGDALGVKAEDGAARPAGAPASPLRPGDALCVGGRLTVSPGTAPGAPHVVLEWASDPVADMVADAALATLLALEGPPGGVLAAEEAHEAARGSAAEEATRWRLFQQMLAAQFGPCALDEDAATLTLGDADGEAEAQARKEPRAVVSLRTGEVMCEDQARRERIAKVFERIGNALLPLPVPPQPED